jgi:hypothetical protein
VVHKGHQGGDDETGGNDVEHGWVGRLFDQTGGQRSPAGRRWQRCHTMRINLKGPGQPLCTGPTPGISMPALKFMHRIPK